MDRSCMSSSRRCFRIPTWRRQRLICRLPVGTDGPGQSKRESEIYARGLQDMPAPVNITYPQHNGPRPPVGESNSVKPGGCPVTLVDTCHSRKRGAVVDRRRPRCGGFSRSVVGDQAWAAPLHCGRSWIQAREILGGSPAPRCWRPGAPFHACRGIGASSICLSRSPRQVYEYYTQMPESDDSRRAAG